MRQESYPPWVRQFFLPVTIFLLLLLVPYLLRPVARVLFAVFAGILLAVFLDGSAALLRRGIPVPRGAALGIVILLIFLVFSGLLWVGGAQVAEQAAGLTERLPAAIEKVRSYIEGNVWLRRLWSWMPQGSGEAGQIFGNIGKVFSSFFEFFAHVVIIIFTGIYVAATPNVYTNAVLSLVPPERRPRGREVMQTLGRVMRYWLVGRLASMLVLGVLTAIGLLLIGAPLALILGVIAGLLSFIPYLGPFLSAIPAVLVGMTESLTMAGWVVLVFFAVQLVESYLITPLIARQAVKMPPAFVVTGQFLMGVLVGFYGVLLATPLLVLFTVLVQMLYIQDVFGEPVQTLGDRSGKTDQGEK